MNIFKKFSKKIHYKFLGWKNEEIKKQFHNSISFWGQEIATGRHLPRSPEGVMLIDDKEDKDGTILNSKITIHYLPEYIDIEKIDEFIKNSDILLEKIN